MIAVRYSAACSLAEHRRIEDLELILLAFDAEHVNWFRLVPVSLTYGLDAVPTLLRVLDDPTGRYSRNIVGVAIRALGSLRTSKPSTRWSNCSTMISVFGSTPPTPSAIS